jgi:predicted ATPase/class 3 adenylate cyclase
MTDLPSGTVTLLFTDIEGSTRLLQQLGDKFSTLIAEHDRLLREMWAMYHGSVIHTQGDSFFVVFSRAAEAVMASVQCQRLLAAHAWPEGVSVRVRMGMHTGEPQINGSNYVGIDIHRAARIAAAAHGGQVLLSQATCDLVENELPAGVSLRDMGYHRLKDLRQPKHLYQLVIAGLPSDFPPLKSRELTPHNLPVQLTSFIGRSREMDEVRGLLSAERLLTLTGAGGSGKTRLALQAAAGMIDHFLEGVFFVALAPVSDPGLVASTIAQSIGIHEAPGMSIVETLIDFLQGKSLLLILDNFEQVITAAPLVADLLASCSQLKFLITSREGLRISGEREYLVPPLELPDLAQISSLETLAQNPAIELFIQRAQEARPDFKITNDTAPAIAEICYRLDGLPLAIELAAARIRLMPPRAMLARLEHRLEFLTGGRRDLPLRQQTLRNAIAWSYDLLDANEQKLFRRMSVFVGSCSLEAIEAVAEDDPESPSLLDQIGSLLEKSLLREVDGIDNEPRFVMLEMLREFGLEQLEASGEQDSVRRHHATFFLELAEQAGASSMDAEQVQWMKFMEQDHDNLRLALEWSRTAEGAGEICVRLAGTLGTFWEARGYFSEGRERLSAVLLTDAAQGRTAARARLLARAAELAYRQSDYPATTSFAQESLDIYRAVGDRQGIASALIKLGNAAMEVGDSPAASVYLEEALAIWRELKDNHGIARALISLGWIALRSGEYQLADAKLDEALALSRELKDTRRIGFELSGLGEVALRQSDYSRATGLVEESLELRRQLGNKWGVGVSLGLLGWIAMRQEDWDGAVSRLGESLGVRREIGDRSGCAWCLERLSAVALKQGETEKSARLLGAASALRASTGSVIDPVDQPAYESLRSSLRRKLGELGFKAAWDAGYGLTLEQAVTYALAS